MYHNLLLELYRETFKFSKIKISYSRKNDSVILRILESNEDTLKTTIVLSIEEDSLIKYVYLDKRIKPKDSLDYLDYPEDIKKRIFIFLKNILLNYKLNSEILKDYICFDNSDKIESIFISG